MKKVLYFAYGSNLYQDRLVFRVGDTKAVRPLRLEGWKLVFNVRLSKMYAVYGNIVKGTPEDFVEGVLYDLSPEQFDKLDNFERLYHKYFFDVDEDTLACVYIGDEYYELYKEELPDIHYLNVIIAGCLEHELNETANKLIKFRSLNYKLKKGKYV